MIDPITLTLSSISLVGSIIVAIIQLFKSGWSCDDIRSSCCIFNVEVNDDHENSSNNKY